MDQITAGIAAGALAGGDQLPTVRQLAVDLTVNPNTVIRAYRELEIRGILETAQGTGTFISEQEGMDEGQARRRRLEQFVGEIAARAGAAGFTVDEIVAQLRQMQGGEGKTRR